MAGSGKSTAICYLKDKYGWPNVYFGDATFDRMREQGLELNYENERQVREQIRQELGMGAYAVLALPKIEKAHKKSDTVLVESLYSWEEYKILREKFGEFFFVIAVYASPVIRFKRLSKRSQERPIKNKAEFQARDYTEIEKTDKGGPIARADFTVINESSQEDLCKGLDGFIKVINNK
jgi:dephospho-CoA kinase